MGREQERWGSQAGRQTSWQASRLARREKLSLAPATQKVVRDVQGRGDRDKIEERERERDREREREREREMMR
jgi:hypothetical protein